MSAFMACAGDPRIVGSYPTAFNSGNFLEFARLKGERWGWNVKPKPTGPAGETASKTLKMFDNPRGKYYQRLFDPVHWGDLLKGKFIMPAVGTNDHLFHLLSDRLYVGQLKSKTAFLRVPNYGHGRETPRHAMAWRFAVAAALLHQNVPSVTIDTRETGGKVAIVASLRDAANIKRLTVYTARDSTGDYRKAKWSGRDVDLPRNPNAPAVLATLEKPVQGTLAVFAQLIAAGPETGAITSSNVIELGTPVLHSLEQ